MSEGWKGWVGEGRGPEEKFENPDCGRWNRKKPQIGQRFLITAAGRLFLTDPKDICLPPSKDGVSNVGHQRQCGHGRPLELQDAEELFENLDPNCFGGRTGLSG